MTGPEPDTAEAAVPPEDAGPDGLPASPVLGLRAVTDPGAVRHERLPMLDVVVDRMVRSLATALRVLFDADVRVDLDALASVRFGDHLAAMPAPVLVGVFRADAWDGSGLVAVDRALAYATLDLLLGDRRGGGSARPDARAFTAIEIGLVQPLVEAALGELAQAFRPLAPADFVLERIETDPRLAAVARPAHTAVRIGVAVDVAGRTGRVEIVLPHATIEPVRELLMQSFMGERLGHDPVWEGHLATELWQAEVALDAVLHETTLPLRRVLDLKVGDTLMFEQKPGDLVTVRCGAWPLVQGRIGRVDDAIAVQVSRPLRQPRTSLHAFEAATAPRSDP